MSPERTRKSSSYLPWQRLSLRARGFVVLAIPLVLFTLALNVIALMERRSAEASAAVLRSSGARSELQVFSLLHRDVERAAREYAARRDPRDLAAYREARDAAAQTVDRLSSLVDDAAAVPGIAALRSAAREIQTVLEQSSSTIPEDAWRAPFDRIRTSLARLRSEQDARFELARQAQEQARRRFLLVLLFCSVFGPLLVVSGHMFITGRLRSRLSAVEDNARRLAHDFPLEPFPAGADEVSGLARQIENAAFLLRRRERELRDSERRYRELFDRAPTPYEETDREGVVTRFNQAVCVLLKCPPNRVVGRRAWDFLAPDHQEAFRAAMMERMAAGTESGPYECEYYLDDGSRISVEIREILIRDDNAEVTGVCRSLMDVTERNIASMAARKVEQYALELRNKNEQLGRALDAARSATEAKSRFLAGISHELRTPLNGIIGFSELMYDGRVGSVSEQHREFLSDILTSARHLLRLINDILDLSKIEAGRMEFRPERRFVHSIVYEVCDVLRALADKKQLRVETDVPQDVVVVLDSSRFKQVLYNYLSNAIKFTGPGGEIKVRISVESEDRFRLDVEDTGIGIDPAEISMLFHEFQQLPNSRHAEQGTGLGLALTRTIVESQGGKVSASSRLGYGSVFSAVLPLDTTPFLRAQEAAAEAARDARALGTAPGEASPNPARITGS